MGIEYFIMGLLLGISPCMLPLLPLIASQIAHGNYKYVVLVSFLVVTTLLSFGVVQLAIHVPYILTVLMSLTPIIMIISGLIWMEVLILSPIYLGNENVNRLTSLILLPLCAGGCVLPAYFLVLSATEAAIIPFLMLNLGINMPVVIYTLLFPVKLPSKFGYFMDKFKKFCGALLLLTGLMYNYASAQVTQTDTISVKGTHFYLIGADWCTNCSILKKALARDGVQGIEYIDVTRINQTNKLIILQFRAEYIPLFIVMRDGVEIKRIEGVKPDEIKAALEEYKPV